jgi:NAD(P)H-dependent flavin oxidoreductase YrpB (nitropropane dioxygenase family)
VSVLTLLCQQGAVHFDHNVHMKTAICDMLGIDIPLLAFSHCRDVVAAVTNAGGFGVLGATTYTPEELERELAWIDAEVGGKPYGVDIIVPERYTGKGQRLSSDQFADMIPAEYRDFIATLLKDHGIEPAERSRAPRVSITDDEGDRLLEVSFDHAIKLIANALGRPPKSMLEAGKAHGVPVAALVGAREHAIKQVDAGVDILVAAGTEAGGHCGEVTTMVLIPEVIEAIKGIREVPVLAAGGIVTGRQMAAAVAMGAAGAWTGSVWLTTEEAETAPYTKQRMLAATSRDTVRSTCRTGKPTRQLRSDWTDAWESGNGPQPLPMPLQSMLSEPVLRRIDTLATNGDEGARALATYWVGQGVGLMNTVKSARQVVYEFAEDYLAAAERLAGSLGD